MSAFKEYFEERTGGVVLEQEWGFIALQVGGKECLISEMYVKPEHRCSQACNKLLREAEAFAKSKGCTMLSGNISIGAANSKAALIAALKFGFDLFDARNGVILITRGIE